MTLIERALGYFGMLKPSCVEIPLSTEGDEGRIIKHANIRLYAHRDRHGRLYFEAVHKNGHRSNTHLALLHVTQRELGCS
jgi:hypothetical protein